MRLFRAFFFLFALCLLTSVAARAQNDPNFETGLKPFGSVEAGNIDTVNLANGTLTFKIPLISYPQRGGKLNLSYYVEYVSGGAFGGEYCYPPPVNECYIEAGFAGMSEPAIIDDNAISVTQTAAAGLSPAYFSVNDPDGTSHEFGATGTNLMESVDATGWQAVYGTYTGGQPGITSVTRSDGSVYRFNPYLSSITDVNGNQITYPTPPAGPTIDTMGRTIPAFPTTYSTNPSDFANCTGSVPTAAVYIWNLPGRTAVRIL